MRRITAAALGLAFGALAATCGQKGPLTPPPPQDASAGPAAVATHALRP